MSAIESALAAGPAKNAAGSPGRACDSKNVTTITPARLGSVPSSRFQTKLTVTAPSLPTDGIGNASHVPGLDGLTAASVSRMRDFAAGGWPSIHPPAQGRITGVCTQSDLVRLRAS